LLEASFASSKSQADADFVLLSFHRQSKRSL
jgi:hypothetical protein